MAARLQKIESNLDVYNLKITTFLKEVLQQHPDKEIEDLCYSSLSSPDSVITFDGEFPDRYFDEIMEYLEMKPEYFHELCDKFRSPHLWKKINGKWELKSPIWNGN